MRFLLDVHVSKSIAQALERLDHDVLRAALAHPTATDRELLDLSVAQARIIITQDSDFSDLIFAFGCPVPPALIFVRCAPADQPKMADRIIEILSMPQLQRHIAVLTPTTTRYRPFPKAANDHG